MNKKILSRSVTFLCMAICLFAVPQISHGYYLPFEGEGSGKSKEEAVYEAELSIITSAFENVMSSEAKSGRNYELIKDLLSKNRARYFHGSFDEPLSYSKKKKVHKVKIRRSVDMAAVKSDLKDIILPSATGNASLPSISIASDEDKIAPNLMEKFNSYGYNYIDYEQKLKEYGMQAEDFDISDMSMEKVESLIEKAGIDYLVYVKRAEYKETGTNSITGESESGITLTIEVLSTKSSARHLAGLNDTVLCTGSPETIEERTYEKAVNAVFSKINSQIVSSWAKEKSVFTAYIKNVSEDQYFDIIDIMAPLLGDDNPKFKNDPVSGRISYFQMNKELTFNDRRKMRSQIKKLGLDSVTFPDNNSIEITGENFE